MSHFSLSQKSRFSHMLTIWIFRWRNY